MKHNFALPSLLLAILLFLPLIPRSVGLQSYPAQISSSGTVVYPPPPPPPPPGSYYDYWVDERIDTDFLPYFSDGSFDFDTFFTHMYDITVKEIDDVPATGGLWEDLDTWTPNPIIWNPCPYNPGEPIGNGIIETYADRIVYPNGTYRDKQDNVYSGGISAAINSLGAGEHIVFIRDGTYVERLTYSGKTELMIAGNGWNTIIKLPDGSNQPVIMGSACNKIILRDFQVDGNRANNIDNAVTYGVHHRNYCENILYENIKAIHVRRMGFHAWDSSKIYMVNLVSIDSGWNAFEHSRCSQGCAVALYGTEYRDVGYSTWGSNNILVAYVISHGPLHDGLGFNDANWGIGVECQSTSPIRDSYNIIIRNSVSSENNVGSEWWRGTGIFSASEETSGSGSYNIIIYNNVCKSNNRAGIHVRTSVKYVDRGHTVLVMENFCEDNDIFDQGQPNAGNYLILRSGVILRNNV